MGAFESFQQLQQPQQHLLVTGPPADAVDWLQQQHQVAAVPQGAAATQVLDELQQSLEDSNGFATRCEDTAAAAGTLAVGVNAANSASACVPSQCPSSAHEGTRGVAPPPPDHGWLPLALGTPNTGLRVTAAAAEDRVPSLSAAALASAPEAATQDLQAEERHCWIQRQLRHPQLLSFALETDKESTEPSTSETSAGAEAQGPTPTQQQHLRQQAKASAQEQLESQQPSQPAKLQNTSRRCCSLPACPQRTRLRTKGGQRSVSCDPSTIGTTKQEGGDKMKKLERAGEASPDTASPNPAAAHQPAAAKTSNEAVHLQRVLYLYPSICEKRLTVSAVCSPRLVQSVMEQRAKLDQIFDSGRAHLYHQARESLFPQDSMRSKPNHSRAGDKIEEMSFCIDKWCSRHCGSDGDGCGLLGALSGGCHLQQAGAEPRGGTDPRSACAVQQDAAEAGAGSCAVELATEAPGTTTPPATKVFVDLCGGPGAWSLFILSRCQSGAWEGGGLASHDLANLSNARASHRGDIFAAIAEEIYGFGVTKKGSELAKSTEWYSTLISHSHFQQDPVLNFEEGVALVVADGGFQLSLHEGRHVENLQELISGPLLLSELLGALLLLQEGGHFVLKLFDCFSVFTASVVYLVGLHLKSRRSPFFLSLFHAVSSLHFLYQQNAVPRCHLPEAILPPELFLTDVRFMKSLSEAATILCVRQFVAISMVLSKVQELQQGKKTKYHRQQLHSGNSKRSPLPPLENTLEQLRLYHNKLISNAPTTDADTTLPEGSLLEMGSFLSLTHNQQQQQYGQHGVLSASNFGGLGVPDPSVVEAAGQHQQLLILQQERARLALQQQQLEALHQQLQEGTDHNRQDQ
ncbi:ftsj-like methyltransferase domain-containing protein [Cyclospora cayetanensis]|uniref:Cap-specific mRNA (nucleoside-2'-O-)-methyltransferase 1 n=1 Tax=Cyclospora cayetanensis TaxID=88456 RepID=A0A1D3CWE7_9EIME|nr:ftsj-like methyltransferase domain-containing protein [Cyclospora cayetanensis]